MTAHHAAGAAPSEPLAPLSTTAATDQPRQPSLLRSAWAVAQFELRRSMTPQRLSVSLVLVLFPPAILLVLLAGGITEASELVIGLTTGMVLLLSLLLWATPNVYTELEGKGWTYVTSRAHGRLAILLGKYGVAVMWASVISCTAATLCMIHANIVHGFLNAWHTWFTIIMLLLLASVAYGAIFSLMGVIFYRRAMVLAAAYVLIFEVFVATVPANVSKITTRYHLQNIALNNLGWFVPGEPQFDDDNRAGPDAPSVHAIDIYKDNFGLYPSPIHVGALVIITALSLAAAALIIRHRQYITAEEV
jgi:hypothetical protein